MISLKNIFKSALLLGLTTAMVGCSDMLESDSERQNFEPSIESKTDSVFYAYGIFEAMQQLADQYVFQGEMRGDLVKTTRYTDNNLRQLADFSATTANKYDSAYVYYRVINNCNYYLAHRKKDLYTGSTNVVMPEYAGVAAIRAWAYLQLGRNYEKVPFFTEPLTEISQIDNNKFPELSLEQIVGQLAPELEKYTGYKLPTYGVDGSAGTQIGHPNWESSQKEFFPQMCFIPVDVVLGDMYLESGNYDAAARHFVIYLTQVAKTKISGYIAPMQYKRWDEASIIAAALPEPNQMSMDILSVVSWSNIYSRNSTNDIISYIPMAVNKQSGPVTKVPLTFGFNYYATSEENKRFGGLREPYIEEIQIAPSDAFNTLSDSTEYYYYFKYSGQKVPYDSIRACKGGDMRFRSIVTTANVGDSTLLWIDKYKYANIILYRTSTVWLHLAEAFNRLGMPDAAFAILKDGISEDLINPTTGAAYMTAYSQNQLQTTYPLLSTQFIELFPREEACGIHSHGAGKATGDCPGVNKYPYWAGVSPYQFDRIVGKKLDELNAKVKDKSYPASITIGTTKQDTINAVEDILCDEYALELAFEGNRYYDLLRLSNHKNGHSNSSSAYDGSPAAYGASYGTRWLENKLADRNWNESKRYLPFK